jgi:Flp pilus assembly protein TadG
MSVVQHVSSLATKFHSTERGSITIIFAFVLTVLGLSAGLAVDYSRVLHARTVLSNAVDAAGLAVGRAMLDHSLSEADAIAIGTAYFQENSRNLITVGTTIPAPNIVIDPTTTSVIVTATANVPTTLMAIGGFTTVAVPATATIHYDRKDLEIGMALDVTGSMSSIPAGGGMSKIDGLKAAFERFANTLMPPTPTLGRRVRIGVAPYSASVNLGTLASAASQGRSADGCVTERLNTTSTDQRPTIGGYFGVAADGTANMENTTGGGGLGFSVYSCPSPQVMPLSDQRQALINHVRSFSPNGGTGGHMGIQWGWNLVSENYSTFWPAAGRPDSYSKTTGSRPTLVKAVILMTDGNFNVSYRSSVSRVQAIALCDAMKAKGVTVFAVGFGLGTTPDEIIARDMLRACATAGTQYFADASNAAELDTTLQQFAATLDSLRINN